MKKRIACLLSLVSCLCAVGAADAHMGRVRDDARFLAEVREGLDVHVARRDAWTTDDPAFGELGREVFGSAVEARRNDYSMYIPVPMYVRMGGGLNLGFATMDADIGSCDSRSARGGLMTNIGLGWNMSSYVRTEIDFQALTLNFEGENFDAHINSVGANLYFDFARRWIRRGDITFRRTFMPFMGIGAAVGHYQFTGADGASGAFVAPRAQLGFGIALTNLMTVDIAYQYQIFIGDFGWYNPDRSVAGISSIIATARFNF